MVAAEVQDRAPRNRPFGPTRRPGPADACAGSTSRSPTPPPSRLTCVSRFAARARQGGAHRRRRRRTVRRLPQLPERREASRLGPHAGPAAPLRLGPGRAPPLWGLWQELPAHGLAPHVAPALLRAELRALLPPRAPARARLDAARRRRLLHSYFCRLSPARRRGPGHLGDVLRSDRQPHRRHARKSGPSLDGRIARSPLSAARPRAGRVRRAHPARLEDPRRPWQGHSHSSPGRPPAA